MVNVWLLVTERTKCRTFEPEPTRKQMNVLAATHASSVFFLYFLPQLVVLYTKQEDREVSFI